MNPIAFKIMNAVMPPISRLLCAPAGYGRIGSVESRNKIRTIEGVEFAATILGGAKDVAELVDRVRRSDPHRALWLAEGLGLHVGKQAVAGSKPPQKLLTEGEGRQIPENMLLMVHAGMAMAFARHHLDLIGKSPAPDAIRSATRQTAKLIDENSIPGYSGIAYEAWGMAVRFFYRPIFPAVMEAMATIGPGHVPYMWHGAGRAAYFIDFMPSWNEPWPAFAKVRREGADRVSRLNLMAGVASAFVLVNMRTPEIMEAVLRERLAQCPAEDAAAFSQGIVCSMVMRQDTVPDEENTMRFVRHVPATDVENLWERIVAGPSRRAVETLHPKLRAAHRLDDVICYPPSEEIQARAEAGRNPS